MVLDVDYNNSTQTYMSKFLHEAPTQNHHEGKTHNKPHENKELKTANKPPETMIQNGEILNNQNTNHQEISENHLATIKKLEAQLKKLKSINQIQTTPIENKETKNNQDIHERLNLIEELMSEINKDRKKTITQEEAKQNVTQNTVSASSSSSSGSFSSNPIPTITPEIFSESIVVAVKEAMKRKREDEGNKGYGGDMTERRRRAAKILDEGSLQKQFRFLDRISYNQKIKILNLEFFELRELDQHSRFSNSRFQSWEGFNNSFMTLISMMTSFAPLQVPMAVKHLSRLRTHVANGHDSWKVISYSNECRTLSTGVPGADWEDPLIERCAFEKCLGPQTYKKYKTSYGNQPFSSTPFFKKEFPYFKQNRPNNEPKICFFFEKGLNCPYAMRNRCRYIHNKEEANNSKTPQNPWNKKNSTTPSSIRSENKRGGC